MRPISHQMLTIIPATFAVLLLLLVATPFDLAKLSLAPNVAWLMTLAMVAIYPPAWPRGFTFALGLLQDVLFGTPLGSQALLTLMLAQWVNAQSHRQDSQLFRIRWMEAAGVIIVWHILLWALMQLMGPDASSLRSMLRAGLVNALWYPIFYACVGRAFRGLGIRD